MGPDLQVKDLRRHYAIHLTENGALMHDIQQVQVHSSVATRETLCSILATPFRPKDPDSVGRWKQNGNLLPVEK